MKTPYLPPRTGWGHARGSPRRSGSPDRLQLRRSRWPPHFSAKRRGGFFGATGEHSVCLASRLLSRCPDSLTPKLLYPAGGKKPLWKRVGGERHLGRDRAREWFPPPGKADGRCAFPCSEVARRSACSCSALRRRRRHGYPRACLQASPVPGGLSPPKGLYPPIYGSLFAEGGAHRRCHKCVAEGCGGWGRRFSPSGTRGYEVGGCIPPHPPSPAVNTFR